MPNDASPVWIPSEQQIQSTNIFALMQTVSVCDYAALHAWSVNHRAEFWEQIIQRLGIRFHQGYRIALDLSKGIESPQWLVDAKLNIVESCFQAADDAPAIVSSVGTLTYAELHTLVNRVANGLADFKPGDAGASLLPPAIAVVLPMTIEAVAIYLGIIKAGCAVVSIADSFSADEIAVRLKLTNAKAVFTQDYIVRSGKQLPLYDKVIAANAPQAIVIGDPKRECDRAWTTFLSNNPHFDAIPADPDATTNILFSSGTTGTPKAIPWTHTTPIKCASDGHLHQDIHPGDVVAWSTSLGWMMGPWLIYASLINRAAIALYYDSPSDRAFGQFVQDANVTMLGVVPSLVSTWKTTGCMEGLDWSNIKCFSSTGECSNPQDMRYLMNLAGNKPIIEYCGGTEIGGGYITGTMVQPCTPARFTTPALGLDVAIFDEDYKPATRGEAFIVPPSIGLSTRLLNQDHHKVYFADTPLSLRRHGDQLERLENGDYRAQGRVDDTMNLSGIKVSAVEIEQVLNRVEGIVETAAIAIPPVDGGPCKLVIYAVAEGEKLQLLNRLQTALKQHLNPLFKIHDLVLVETLPRTASNKIMRRLLRDAPLQLGTSLDK